MIDPNTKKYNIYLCSNILNNKKYVGQTCRTIYKRWSIHCAEASRNSLFYFHRAIKKYGKENFKVELLEKCIGLNNANELEIKWIKFFNSNNQDFGYNICDGGSGTPGHKLSEEAKNKLSIFNKGKKLSEETKRKIGLAGIGRKHSEETKKIISEKKKGKTHIGTKWNSIQREKIIKSMTGRKASPETRLKQSLAAKRKKPMSEETKKKISVAITGRQVSKSTCKKISRAKMKNFDKRMLVRMYKKLKTIKSVAESLGCARMTMSKYFKKYGIK